MQRREWLVNDLNPRSVRANTFAVEEGPVRLVAAGLALTERVSIEVRVDAHTTVNVGVDHFWAPLYRNGAPVELRGDNNQIVLVIPGVYRVARAGTYAQPIAVALWEDETEEGRDIRYVDYINQPYGAVTQPPCAALPAPEGDNGTFQVTLCDATGNPTVLVYKATKPDNSQCPPVASTVVLIGYIDASGAFQNASMPPAGLSACRCEASTPQGVLAAW